MYIQAVPAQQKRPEAEQHQPPAYAASQPMRTFPQSSALHAAGRDHTAPPPPLRGLALLAARVGWIILAGLILALYLGNAPLRFTTLHQSSPPLPGGSLILPADLVPALAEWGLSIHAYAVWIFATETFVPTVFFLAAAFIFWRRHADRGAFFVSLALLSYGATETSFGGGVVNLIPAWRWPFETIQAVGAAMVVVVFSTFPDGQFTLPWARPLTIGWCALVLVWLLFPRLPFNIVYGETFNLTPFRSLALNLGWNLAAFYALVHRYRHATGTVRLQMQWMVYALAVMLTTTIIRYGIDPLLWLIPLDAYPRWNVLRMLLLRPLYWLSMLVVPVACTVAMLRFRLWGIETVIRRTLLYTALSLMLTLVALATIVLSQALLRGLSSIDTELTAVLTTLLCVVLFEPLRRRLQAGIDRRFDRARVDFRPTITAFSRELHQYTQVSDLLRALLQRSVEALKIAYGAIYLRGDDGALRLAEGQGAPPDTPAALDPALGAPPDTPAVLDPALAAQLRPDAELHRPRDPRWPLIVPLAALREGERAVIGALALGPRRSEEPYRREAVDLLLALADRAGTAVTVAQLVAYQLSPAGRAEALAYGLARDPATALGALHDLSRGALASPEQAAVLAALPGALRSLAAPGLAELAHGYRLVVEGHEDDALLAAGLRALAHATDAEIGRAIQETAACSDDGRQTTDHGPRTTDDGRRTTDHSQSGTTKLFVVGGQPSQVRHGHPAGATSGAGAPNLYRLCLDALEAETALALAGLTPLVAALALPGDGAAPSSSPLFGALACFREVLGTLDALPRLSTTASRLTGLRQARAQLDQLERRLPADLDPVARQVARRITRRWLTLVDQELQAIQGQARLELRLITGSVAEAPALTLAVELANHGRGAARQVELALSPGVGYAAPDGAWRLAELPPGEHHQIELTLHPRGGGPLRPTFTLSYDDAAGQRAPQTLTFPVTVLTAPPWREPIPNPYLAGMPLRPGSPLFVGREDDIATIARAVTRPLPTALVLTGQRRMGKTSLLQQLGARLDDALVAVYLDGQRLALEPDLPRLLGHLAGRIAHALGLPAPHPAQGEPPSYFAERFLPGALEAAGGRRLLLILDEIEALEEQSARGRLDPALFGYLRHLMQHEARLALIVAGAHRLDELRPVAWAGIFNAAQHHRLGCLRGPAARELIVAPLGGRLCYDDLAIHQLLRLSGGHPYFLQLLCQTLVDAANERRQTAITLEQVLAAREPALELGEAPLADLWSDSSADEQAVLAALARSLPLAASRSTAQLVTAIDALGLALPPSRIEAALQRLAWRDLLAVEEDPAEEGRQRYGWRLGLLSAWVARTQTWS